MIKPNASIGREAAEVAKSLAWLKKPNRMSESVLASVQEILVSHRPRPVVVFLLMVTGSRRTGFSGTGRRPRTHRVRLRSARTQLRRVSRLTRRSSPMPSKVWLGWDRYSATASALNSAE